MNEQEHEQLQEVMERLETLEETLDSLKQQREQLRQEIIDLMLKSEQNKAKISGETHHYSASVSEFTKFEYDEQLLKERLGSRFPSILYPDSKKMRHHKEILLKQLEPIIEKVGSIHKDQVKSSILNGTTHANEFENAFKKETKHRLVLRKISNNKT